MTTNQMPAVYHARRVLAQAALGNRFATPAAIRQTLAETEAAYLIAGPRSAPLLHVEIDRLAAALEA